MKKLLLKLTSALMMVVVIVLCDISAYAGEIIIDGQYDDWNQNSADSLDGIFFSKVDMVVEADMLYIFAEEYYNQWNSYFTYVRPVVVMDDGTELQLVLTEGEKSNGCKQIVVRNGSWSEIAGAQTARTKDGDMCRIEMSIPVTGAENISYVRINTNYSESVDVIPNKLENVKDDSETEETTEEDSTEENTTEEETTVENITSSGSGIIIDGMFEDWKSYPNVLDTNWNMPEEDRSEQNCRSIGLVVEDEYIYVHIKMIAGWSDPFNSNYFNVTAGGETIDVYFYTEDGIPISDANIPNGTHDFMVCYHNGTPGMKEQTPIDGAEALFVRKEGQPDELEVKIPLNMFEIVYGMDISDIKEVNVKNPNLFDQGATVAGSSSAPLIGVAVCLLSVAGGTTYYSKKKSHNREK